jgi:phage gp46-like protein
LLLELEAAVEPGYEVQMPKVDKVLESFGMVDWDNPGDKLDENGNVVSTYQYRLEPLLSGTYPIPAFTFEFHDVNSPEEKKYELTTEPFDIEVTSLLEDDRAELKIEDIEGVVEIPKKPSFWWAWALGVIAVLTALGTWLWLRRRRVKELIRIFKPAHELAYERLRVLVKEDLVGAGRIKEFYERISDILRHYIEHRFSLRAPERTTEEFLYELASTNILPESDKQNLAQFLQHCDLVKFAKHEPTSEQIQQAFDLVKAFIEKTKSAERKVDVTDMYIAEETTETGSA